MRPKVLIVDDEESVLKSLSILLKEFKNYDIFTAKNYSAAIPKIKEGIDLVLTDLSMPDKSGIEVLKAAKNADPDIQVILMTAYSSVSSAVEAMRLGAFDYLIKPFDNDKLLVTIDNALKLQALSKKNSGIQKELESKYGFQNIIGKSPQIEEAKSLIKTASEVNSTVLITGESGTGKELAAKAIHYLGPRRSNPFVCINCTTIPSNLLESELFGYEKGAFSGADKTKVGKFETANTGTVFLDEIGEMSMELQAKLLRVIQEKEIERLGATTQIKIDVRIIAATNKDIKRTVREGKFREDLFFRLNVIAIHMPPLRERKEDIPLLIDYYLSRKCQELGRQLKVIEKNTAKSLLNYDYPGNVRELDNILERSILLSKKSEITNQNISFLTPANNISGLKSNMLGFHQIEDEYKNMQANLIKATITENPKISNEELAIKLGTTRRILELRLKEFNIKR